MTQKLTAYGKEGAEILSEIINDIFTPSIDSIYKNGGFVSSFAGDAFTSVFPMNDSRYAVRASMEINNLFHQYGLINTKFGDFELYAKIGLSYGPLEFGIIDAPSQKAYYFRGKAIADCAESESRAKQMQIIADKSFMDNLPSSIKMRPVGKGYYQLLPDMQLLDMPFISKERKAGSDPSLYTESKFVQKEVLELRYKGEFREIASCFIRFSEKEEFEKNLSIIIEKCHQYGGFFNKVDFGDKGAVILIIFGAPVSMEKLFQRGADFALSLKQIEKFTFKAGLTAGIAFTGFIGSDQRQEYTALGSVVNLSARLMSKAEWGQILCDINFKQKLSTQYLLKPVKAMKLKGFEKDIEGFTLNGKIRSSNNGTETDIFIGRDDETKRLKDLMSPVLKSKFGGIIFIDGPAGIGKTHFINKFNESIKDIKSLTLICDDILRKAFNPFESFLYEFFGQSLLKNMKENSNSFIKKYKEIIEDTRDEKLKSELIRGESIIGALIGLKWENSLYSILDPKRRYENTLYSVKNLFLALSLKTPLVLIIEDGYCIDSSSLELIDILTNNVENYPFAVIIICRPEDDGSPKILFSRDKTENIIKRIELGPFTKDMVSELIVNKMKKDNIPEATKEFIWSRSGGNPFYAEQLTLYLLEQGLLLGKASLDEDTIAIPPGINQIIISRIDKLASSLKDTIRTATVLGREFNSKILMELVIKSKILNSDKEFITQIDNGCKEQIWEESGFLRYIFKYAIVRDAVYDIQLRGHLRKMHNLAGIIIEKLHKNSLSSHYDELAEHFSRAENLKKAVEYTEKAANDAKEKFHNKTAINFYDRLVKYLEDDKSNDRKLIESLIKKGNVLEITGKWVEARETFSKALLLSEKIDAGKLKVDSMIYIGNIQRLMGNYEQALKTLEHAQEIAEDIEYEQGSNLANNVIGSVYYMLNNYDDAMEYYKKVLDYQEAFGEKKAKSVTLGNIGMLYCEMGDYGKAMYYCKKQMELAEEIDHKLGINNAYTNVGVVYGHQGNFENAHNYFKKSLSIAQMIGSKQLLSIVLHNLGYTLCEQGNYDQAVKYFIEQKDISEEIGDKHSKSAVMGALGKLYFNKGSYNKAEEYLQEQLKISRKIGDRKGESYAYLYLGDILLSKGEHTSALDFFDKSLIIFDEIGHKKGIAIAYGKMAVVYIIQGNYDKGLELSSKKADLCEEVGLMDELADVASKKGAIYAELGDYPKAIKYYEKQLLISKKTGNKKLENRALVHIGTVYADQSEYEKAMEYYNKGLAIAEETGNKTDISIVLNNMGIIHACQGNYKKAMNCFRMHYSVCLHLGNKTLLSSTLCNMGMLYSYQGNIEQAMKCYSEQLSICREIGDKKNISSVLIELGNIKSYQKKYSEAMNFYEESLKMKEEIGDQRGIGTALHFIGKAYFNQYKYSEAISYYNRSLEIRERLGDKEGVSDIIGLIGDIFYNQGKFKNALSHYKKAIAIKEKSDYLMSLSVLYVSAGKVYSELGQIPNACNLYDKGIKTAKDVNQKKEYAESLYAKAQLLYDNGLRDAEKYNEEAIKTASENNLGDILFWGKLLKHKIDNDSDNLLKMIDNPDMDNIQKHLIYAGLYKLTGRNDYRKKALDFLDAIKDEIPEFQYKKRLNEINRLF